MTDSAIEIRPQPGKQEMFLASPADFALFGGARGGGKSYALLMEAARHIQNPEYNAVLFRRTFPQVMANGGLWETARKIYPLLGGKASITPVPTYTFPSGAYIRFSHMQYEKNTEDWRGSQIAFIGIDEISHFTWGQITALMACNRSTSGIAPLMRATCNPDPDSWLRGFLSWWIGKDGFPIEERAGVLRWMCVVSDEVRWGDTKEELIERYGEDTIPLSVTFVPSKLEDNPALALTDKSYKGRLMAMMEHERLQMLDGNWDARAVAGSYFRSGWFQRIVGMDADGSPTYESEDNKRPPWSPDTIIKSLTEKGTKWVRYWDRAATEESPLNRDPDWTVGALVGKQKNGRFVIGDIVRLRGTPHKVVSAIKATAEKDGKKVRIGLEQEPGASGKSEAQQLVNELAGFNVKAYAKRRGKEEDWKPLSAQAEAGNVDMVRAPWNDELIKELEALPLAAHDDQADACSGAFGVIVSSTAYTLSFV